MRRVQKKVPAKVRASRLPALNASARELLNIAGAIQLEPVANMNTHQPTSSAIQSVEFGFLSTQDVRTLSVKRITNPTTFDSLLHPVAGGLHDGALGAFLDNP